MSLTIQSNKINSTDAKGLISFSDIKNSSQSSYALKTDLTYTVAADELVLFINGGTVGTPSVTLTLPSPNLCFGRNLFVVQRGAYPINVQASTFIDIDQDANGTTTQTGLLPAGNGGWVHLVSNGKYWVAVSKSTALPAAV